ncbi:hypothetical protein CKO11_12345 [Rhodobacter sp. TJ_12]|nr:hypothetical protein [Rhodobacter sp. TJ_12]MBZ4023248.1 hypothetical protein [Rhodobacter sp. TJ_12]
MGFTPEQVKRMSFWEFWACFEGFKAFHGVKSEQTASLDRLRELGVE